MNWALTPNRVEAGFWLILTAGLATGLGLETDWGRQMEWPVTQIAETSPAFAKPVLAEPYRLADPDQLLDVTLRPLFIVTRRPAPIAPPPGPPRPGMVKGQFILTGTTIVAESRLAFMLEKASSKSRVVAEGKEINGIVVKEVSAERVVLSQYDETEVLVLKTSKPPPGAPAPIAARNLPTTLLRMQGGTTGGTAPTAAPSSMPTTLLRTQSGFGGAPAPIPAPKADQRPAESPTVMPAQPTAQPQPQPPTRQPQAPARATIGP